MANTSQKIEQIVDLIEKEAYFTINRPRQFGKTTTLDLLWNRLDEQYLVLSLSFEGVGISSYVDECSFIKMLQEKLREELEMIDDARLLGLIDEMQVLNDFNELNRFISKFVKTSKKEVILMIDECDDSSNNDVFLSFLGLLRRKYQLRTRGRDVTFKSVILAGVHDIKNLRYRVRGSGENYNSPWNIATEFNINMSFNVLEIESLLLDYLSEHPDVKMDVAVIASKLYYFTHGYPFFVSYLCKMIDEQFSNDDKWNVHNLEKVVNELLVTETTNFESLIKNIQNHKDLENIVKMILIDGETISYGNSAPAIKKGLIYGIFARSKDNKLIINHPIYEMKIYQYLTEKMKTNHVGLLKNQRGFNYTNPDQSLNMPLILEKYSKYLEELRDDHQDEFIENNARLLFSIFIKPVINGVGFIYREAVTSDRKRLDVLITYHQFKYVIELKIWDGESYYRQAQEQLADYLERERLEVGYMIVHDFRKKQYKRFTSEKLSVNGKELKIYFV